MVNKVRVAFRLGQALVHTFTLLMARPPRMWGMRASSLWISASVGALLWAAGCPAARSDACPSRGQGRGSCGVRHVEQCDVQQLWRVAEDVCACRRQTAYLNPSGRHCSAV